MKICEKNRSIFLFYNNLAIQNFYALKGLLHPPILGTVGNNIEFKHFPMFLLFWIFFWKYFTAFLIHTAMHRSLRSVCAFGRYTSRNRYCDPWSCERHGSKAGWLLKCNKKNSLRMCCKVGGICVGLASKWKIYTRTSGAFLWIKRSIWSWFTNILSPFCFPFTVNQWRSLENCLFNSTKSHRIGPSVHSHWSSSTTLHPPNGNICISVCNR